jgi:hypothetical protein
MEEHHNISEAKKLIKELSKHCVTSMHNREYSNFSKLPYKVMAFVNSMNWRMKECAEAAIQLLESDYTHPALMLIRSSMENAAITVKLADVVGEVVERKQVTDADDEKLMRLLFANNYRKDDPFTDPNEDDRLKAERIGKHVKRAEEECPGFQRYYSYLCEFVHPNYDGVSQSYSFLDIETGKTDFGPRLNSTHELYDAFTITLVLALTVYLRQIEFIEDNLEDFIHLCDIDIVKQICDKI